VTFALVLIDTINEYAENMLLGRMQYTLEHRFESSNRPPGRGSSIIWCFVAVKYADLQVRRERQNLKQERSKQAFEVSSKSVSRRPKEKVSHYMHGT
jgi:hypothetical protein